MADAVASGLPFLVEVKRGLIVLDLDTDDLIATGETVARFCEDSGLPTLLADSGRNRHLYVNAGRYAADTTEQIKVNFGIPTSAFRSTIRPPLSPHRMGRETALIAPVTVAGALSVLGHPETAKPVSERIMSLLRYGDTNNEYLGNRSAMAIAIAAGFKSAGLTLAHFRAVMLNPDNLGAEKATDLAETGKNVESWITRTWDNAYDGGITADQINDHLTAVETAVLATTWTGRNGQTDHAVMLGLVAIARADGRLDPAPGLRRLTEVCQFGNRDRTTRALTRLVRAGWLTRVNRGDRQSDAYRFVAKQGQPITVPPVVSWPYSATHPVFRQGAGLGPATGRVYGYLTDHQGAAKAATIAKGLGNHRSTVGEALRRLCQFGLAVQSEHGWTLTDEHDLDHLATELGVWDVIQRQQQAHDYQRAQYQQRHATADTEHDDDRRRIEDQQLAEMTGG